MFANNPRIVTNGIVGVWDALMPNTATAATKLYDAAGSTDGTMYNGSCLDFDGTDDDIHTTSDITLSGACAVSVWISSDTSTQYIFSNKSGGPVNLRFGMDGGKMTYQYYSAAWRYLYSTSSIPTTTWTHLAWVRTADNFISFYINGVLDAGPTQALGSGGSASSTTVNGPVNIVGSYWGSSVFNGRMADFKVFNTDLTGVQVKQMYDDSKVIIPDGSQISSLDLWYAMTEGVGIVAYDGSGNGNSGIGQNFDSDEFLSGQTGAPQLVEGYNRPMLFDGSNDYVQVASDGSSTFANQSYTVAGWIQIGDLTSDKGIFSYDFTSHASPYYATHVRVTANELYLMWNDGSSYQYISKTSAFTVNTWHHYACTFTSGSQKIYIDGAEVASGTRADTITYYNQEVWIGKNNYSTSFNSLMNETVVYNSALTLAQVQVLAATGPNGGPLPPDPMSLSNSSNVVGYWRNDGNVTWKDRSGNGNDGTVYGSPDNLLFKQGINGSASTSTGRDGQGFPLLYQNNGAMGFTQTGGSKVIIPHSSDILWDINANFTIITWYKINSNPSGTYPSVWGKGGQHVSGPGYELFLNPDGTSFTLRGTWAGGPTWGMNAAYGSAGNPMDGNWHCVTVAIDRDNPTTGGMLYQDNVRQSAVNISGLGDTTNTTNLTLASAGAGALEWSNCWGTNL